MQFLLDNDEIAAITGYKLAAYQIRWLRESGWPHVIGGDGRPKVARAYAERTLGAVDSADRHEPQLHLS